MENELPKYTLSSPIEIFSSELQASAPTPCTLAAANAFHKTRALVDLVGGSRWLASSETRLLGSMVHQPLVGGAMCRSMANRPIWVAPVSTTTMGRCTW